MLIKFMILLEIDCQLIKIEGCLLNAPTVKVGTGMFTFACCHETSCGEDSGVQPSGGDLPRGRYTLGACPWFRTVNGGRVSGKSKTKFVRRSHSFKFGPITTYGGTIESASEPNWGRGTSNRANVIWNNTKSSEDDTRRRDFNMIKISLRQVLKVVVDSVHRVPRRVPRSS